MKKLVVLLTALFVLVAVSVAVSATYAPDTIFQIPWTGGGILAQESGATIHIQNVDPTGDNIKPLAVIFDQTEECPPNSGDYTVQLTGLIPYGADWELYVHGGKSVMLFSLDAAEADALLYEIHNDKDWFSYYNWLTAYTTGAATYNGVPITAPADRGLMAVHVESGQWATEAIPWHSEETFLYIPNSDGEIYFQNSGDNCASIEVFFKEYGSCGTAMTQMIPNLAPGEFAVLEGMGSGVITATSTQKIGAFVIQNGNKAFTSTASGDDVLYGPYFDRQYETSIGIQNLESYSIITKCYFYDKSGDIIKTQVKRICEGSGEEFYLGSFYGGQYNEGSGHVICVSTGDTAGVLWNEDSAYNLYEESEIGSDLASPIAGNGELYTDYFITNENIWAPGAFTFVVDDFNQNGEMGFNLCNVAGNSQVDPVITVEWSIFTHNWQGSMLFTGVNTNQNDLMMGGITVIKSEGDSYVGMIPFEGDAGAYACRDLPGAGGFGGMSGIWQFLGDDEGDVTVQDTADNFDYVGNPSANPGYIYKG